MVVNIVCTASACLDEVGALVRMSFSLLEATHLHVVLGQEQVGGALLLWEVDTNLYKRRVKTMIIAIKKRCKAHIASFSLSHEFVVELSSFFILIQFGIQSEKNINIVEMTIICFIKFCFHLASFMRAVPSWSLNAMARNRHCTVIQCHVIR